MPTIKHAGGALRFEVNWEYTSYRTEDGALEVPEVVAQYYVGTGLYELVEAAKPAPKSPLRRRSEPETVEEEG